MFISGRPHIAPCHTAAKSLLPDPNSVNMLLKNVCLLVKWQPRHYRCEVPSSLFVGLLKRRFCHYHWILNLVYFLFWQLYRSFYVQNNLICHRPPRSDSFFCDYLEILQRIKRNNTKGKSSSKSRDAM